MGFSILPDETIRKLAEQSTDRFFEALEMARPDPGDLLALDAAMGEMLAMDRLLTKGPVGVGPQPLRLHTNLTLPQLLAGQTVLSSRNAFATLSVSSGVGFGVAFETVYGVEMETGKLVGIDPATGHAVSVHTIIPTSGQVFYKYPTADEP